MAFTDKEKPSTIMTDTARSSTLKQAKFGIGQFGKARFSNPDELTDKEKPSTSHTEVARPS